MFHVKPYTRMSRMSANDQTICAGKNVTFLDTRMGFAHKANPIQLVRKS
ncbi:uncharacterized protein YecT (DUF1311 family) [Arthrobacter sp. 2762]